MPPVRIERELRGTLHDRSSQGRKLSSHLGPNPMRRIAFRPKHLASYSPSTFAKHVIFQSNPDGVMKCWLTREMRTHQSQIEDHFRMSSIKCFEPAPHSPIGVLGQNMRPQLLCQSVVAFCYRPFKQFSLISDECFSGSEQLVILLRCQGAVKRTQNNRAKNAHLVQRTAQPVPQQRRAKLPDVFIGKPCGMLGVQGFIRVI